MSDSILTEAARLISGEKRVDYGDAKTSFQNIATAWNMALGKKLHTPLTGADVALCMVGFKYVRECNKPKRDNRVDLAAYACLEDLVIEPPTTEGGRTKSMNMCPKPDTSPAESTGQFGEPWSYCGADRGGCQCGSISSHSQDSPICDVTMGKWGDTYPALRPVEGTSLNQIGPMVEPYIEMIEYGEVPEEVGKARAFRIVACINALAGMNPEAVKDVVTYMESRLEELSDEPHPSEGGSSSANEELKLVRELLTKLKQPSP